MISNHPYGSCTSNFLTQTRKAYSGTANDPKRNIDSQFMVRVHPCSPFLAPMQESILIMMFARQGLLSSSNLCISFLQLQRQQAGFCQTSLRE